MTVLYVVLAVFAGGMLPMQAAINARLASAIGGTVWAAAVSGLVLTIVLIVAAIAITRGSPRVSGLDVLPWWAWTGGFCGAVLLSATATVVPRLGAASMIALVMTGQVLVSVVLDSFGFLGLTTQPLSVHRSIGVVFLVAGASLMR